MKRRDILLSALAAPGIAPGLAAAQSFPSRPITLLVPFPPGGATDVQMRAFAEAASRAFGVQVLTENRPGAGATLSAAGVARARADGYTIAQFPLPAMRLPFMQRMPFNPRTDFTPIMHLTGYLFIMCVRGDSPYQSWADLVPMHAAAQVRCALAIQAPMVRPILPILILRRMKSWKLCMCPSAVKGMLCQACLAGILKRVLPVPARCT